MIEDRRLQALYPFLAATKRDEEAMAAVLAESINGKVAQHASLIAAFFAANAGALVKAAHAVAQSYRQGGRLLAMGNGGSSCDASHVVVEFQHPVTAGRPALSAINLTADVAMVSAVGNDVGFDQIFVRQVIAQARRGDCLIGLSTSGNSQNLVLAFRKAQEIGVTTIGFSGGTGGAMAKAGLDHCLVVDSDSIHRIQECHLVAYHILWDLVHTWLADDRGLAADHATE